MAETEAQSLEKRTALYEPAKSPFKRGVTHVAICASTAEQSKQAKQYTVRAVYFDLPISSNLPQITSPNAEILTINRAFSRYNFLKIDKTT